MYTVLILHTMLFLFLEEVEEFPLNHQQRNNKPWIMVPTNYFHSIDKIKSQFYSKHFMTSTIFGAIIYLSNIQSTYTTLTLAERAHFRKILCYTLQLSISETKEVIRISSRQEIISKMKCKLFVGIMIHMKRHPRCDYINILSV